MKVASVYIANGFIRARDALARLLVFFGVTPNMLTVAGMAMSVTSAFFLAHGRWTAAACMLIAAAACDMLDGAVARIGGKGSRFGGVLDSTCDRVSDAAIMAGFVYYYLITWPAASGAAPNLTYGLLGFAAIIHATLISYVKSRTHNEIAGCNVGFWQRGERTAAILIGLFSQNPPMILWELGGAAGLTALQRLLCARRLLAGLAATDTRRGVWPSMKRFVFFPYPRLTLLYDLYTGSFIALLIFARIPVTDPMRDLWRHLGG